MALKGIAFIVASCCVGFPAVLPSSITFSLLQYSRLLEPLRPTSKPSAKRLQELLACHKRFCEQQLANKKTARVLDAAFDPAFSQQYMEQLMFDYSPTEDVPWFDGGLAKLFDYFENNPEIWQDAGLFMKVRQVMCALRPCNASIAFS